MTRYTITGNDHDALAIDTGEYVRYADVQADRERTAGVLESVRLGFVAELSHWYPWADPNNHSDIRAIDAELKRIRG